MGPGKQILPEIGIGYTESHANMRQRQPQPQYEGQWDAGEAAAENEWEMGSKSSASERSGEWMQLL